MISEKKIILLYFQASGLNISNIGFGRVVTTEVKLQAFNSGIGSLKKISDYEIEMYLSCFMILQYCLRSEFPGYELFDFVIVRALVLITC